MGNNEEEKIEKPTPFLKRVSELENEVKSQKAEIEALKTKLDSVIKSLRR